MKIVVPIMPRNLEEVEAIDVERLAEADIVEWRADYLPKDDILRVAPAIFENVMVRKWFSLFGQHVKVATWIWTIKNMSI